MTKDSFPASSAQERLWFLHQLEPAVPYYNMGQAIRLHGKVDGQALEWALNRLRHTQAALRTVFCMQDQSLLQVVHPFREESLEHLGITPATPDTLQRILDEEVRRPFDLEKGPLFRARLFQLAADCCVLLLVTHHILADAWSAQILIQQLTSLYTTYFSGKNTPWTRLPAQYSDFALWQQQWLRSSERDMQLVFWRQELAGPTALLQLSQFHLQQSTQVAGGSWLSLPFAHSTIQRLEELARDERTTLYVVTLAAFAALLHLYTRQKHFIIGTPSTNRNCQEYESVIGLFSNTLPLAVATPAGTTFRHLLRQLRETVQRALNHQELPFEQIVRALNPVRDLRRTPLFNVWFALQHVKSSASPPGLMFDTLPLSSGVALFDLSVELYRTRTDLTGRIEYSQAIYSSEEAQRLRDHFFNLIMDASHCPEKRIDDLAIMHPSEVQRNLREFNPAAALNCSLETTSQAFEAQVRCRPAAPAVRCGERTLTFEQLNAEANRLARYLQKLGVCPETAVVLCLEPNLDLAVAVLAVLKAGGVILPCDPGIPAARLRYILDDARARIVLCHRSAADLVPPERPFSAVMLDAPLTPWSEECAEDLRLALHPLNLAYTIYTSGSQGAPKGVQISHEALLSYARPIRDALPLTSLDRVFQFASPGFDVLIEELFPAWLAGASVVFSGSASPLPCCELLGLLQREQVTVIELPLLYWHEFLEELERQPTLQPASLRLVLVGCGKINGAKLSRWQAFGIPLIHVYGLTELTVTSALLKLHDDLLFDFPRAELAFGRPLGNSCIYLLNDSMQPVPSGIPGEIFVGGSALARGYTNCPSVTAARFVPDPFSGRPGARMFRTGDLGRHWPDGNVEFLSRIDRQLSIRGFRVEPGEIESVLLRCSDVIQAAVFAYPESGSPTGLTACVVRRNASLDAATVQSFLRERLPTFMIPNRIVFLADLPYTAHGKLDVHRLAAMLPDPRHGSTPSRVPTTPAEVSVAHIWSEVLRRDFVSTHDNFFDLGGHSLLALHVVARLRSTFGVEISVKDIFEQPTLEELALEVTSRLIDQIELLSEEEAQRLLG